VRPSCLAWARPRSARSIAGCVFQSIAIRDSRASRSPVPRHHDRGFQSIVIGHSRPS
jgi:hypothetical protein